MIYYIVYHDFNPTPQVFTNEKDVIDMICINPEIDCLKNHDASQYALNDITEYSIINNLIEYSTINNFDTKYIKVDVNETDELYFMHYHESIGGCWHEMTYIYLSDLEGVLDIIKDYYDNEHNDECEDCKNESIKLCKKKFIKQLRETKNNDICTNHYGLVNFDIIQINLPKSI